MAEIIPIPTPTFAGRISLRKLRELPRDTFLVSNVYHGEHRAIMVTVGMKTPDLIYSWIKESDLQGRLFYAFACRLDYERWERRRLRSMA